MQPARQSAKPALATGRNYRSQTHACNTPIKWVAGSTNSCSTVLESNCGSRETLLDVLGEHFSLHRYELTQSPMYVHISFRNCVLANRTLFMAMTVYFSVEKNEALLSQLPASSPMCRLGLFPLLATTAKEVALPNKLTHTASSINEHSQQIALYFLGACFTPRRA